MSKSHFCLLSFLLLFSLIISQTLPAEDLVTLKNLSWEEQKNQTRIILETNQPLIYSVTDSPTASEVLVELSNLDLRNLPQELFINTNEVVSLQTFPQSAGQKSKIIVKMTAVRPYHVTAEESKLYIDITNNPDSGGLLAPVTTQIPPSAEKQVDPQVQELEKQSGLPVNDMTDNNVAAPAPAVSEPEPKEEAPPPVIAVTEEEKKSLELTARATEVRDIRVDQTNDQVNVVLVGNGTFQYDVFELSNPSRLVIDLKSVGIAAGVKNVVSSGNELFSKVRLGQYQTSPKVARAVIDLRKKVPYLVTSEGMELRIRLGDGADISSAEPQLPVQEETTEEPAPLQAEIIPAKDEILITPQEKQQPVTTAEMKAPETPAMSNEQFFQIKPDTSLFAQEGGTEGGSQPSMSYGMGTFQEKTISGGQKQYTGEPFSFDFKDIDIKDLFRFIADISGLNVILDPGVKGSVTLKLTEVPWDQALDLICKNQGLGYQVEGNVIRIAPLRTIAAEEKARQDAERQQILSAPLVTKVKPLSYAKAQEIDKVVKRLLTPKGTSILDTRTNTLIITDIDKNIDSIINLIDTLDSRTTQVLIEARIVETRKNFSQAFGIQWGFRGIADPAFGNNTSLQFPNNVLLDGTALTPTSGIAGNPLGGYAVNLPTTQAPNSALLLSAGNILDTFRLDIALMALENTGNGRVISTPKVATQNNTKAEILQGTQIPVQTIANNTVTTTFVNAALRMAVTPQITAEGTIILEVEVENNQPDFARNNFLGTPPINTQKAQTTLLVEDGGTAVIGGIFQARDDYAQGRTPGLHRIPLLGWLFKNTNIDRENRELLIFLTPRILR